MYFVYILYSPSLDHFYKGQTNNIEDRIVRHNTGRNEYTKKGMPWIVVWVTSKETRSEALKLESLLKKYSHRQLIEFVLKYPDGIQTEEAYKLVVEKNNKG